MRANLILATITAATVIIAGAFVAGGYIYDSSTVPADEVAQTAPAESTYSQSGKKAETVTGDEQPADGSANTGRSSGSATGENPNMLDFASCEDVDNRISTSETLSVGESAIVEDCNRRKKERITLSAVGWSGDLVGEGEPEELYIDVKLTNEGKGMLYYGEDRYSLTDETGTEISGGRISGWEMLEQDPHLLAPGESVTYEITAGPSVSPETTGMPLVLNVRSELAPPGLASHQAVSYEFDVPEVPGYLQPVSPEHPANGTGATSVPDR